MKSLMYLMLIPMLTALASCAKEPESLRPDNGTIALAIPELDVYGAVHIAGTPLTAPQMWQFIKWGDIQYGEDYIVIDSLYALSLCIFDTNAFACAVPRGDSTSLVIVRLSPVVSFDTVMSYGSNDIDNWLLNLRGFKFLSRDSIVVGDFSGSHVGKFLSPESMEIMRIGTNWELSLVRTVEGASSAHLARDLSHVLFDVIKKYEVPADSIEEYIVAYYPDGDTIEEMRDPNGRMSSPMRRERGGCLYYILETLQGKNLWKMDANSVRTQLTQVEPPDCVVHAWSYWDSIQIQIEKCIAFEGLADVRFERVGY